MDNLQPEIWFSENLKNFISAKKITQKGFSSQIEITASTLSGYIRGDKLPNIEFLRRMKAYLPNISLDDFLFTPLREDDFVPESSSETVVEPLDLYKYFGDYYLYYLDTTKKVMRIGTTVQSTDLRYGVLYIYKSSQSNTSANCIAVFGIKRRDDAQRVKELINPGKNNAQTIVELLKKNHPHNYYQGKIDITSHHIFITLKQQTDKQDEAHIVLHHQDFNKDYYSGGLGTINSSSTGRNSDPIVQLIGLSKNFIYMSDEEIQDFLKFSSPKLDIDKTGEAAEILKLASELYENNSESAYSLLSNENKKVLLNSYLNELIRKHLESNYLWYGRVSLETDDMWYHSLKSAEEHYLKNKETTSE